MKSTNYKIAKLCLKLVYIELSRFELKFGVQKGPLALRAPRLAYAGSLIEFSANSKDEYIITVPDHVTDEVATCFAVKCDNVTRSMHYGSYGS